MCEVENYFEELKIKTTLGLGELFKKRGIVDGEQSFMIADGLGIIIEIENRTLLSIDVRSAKKLPSEFTAFIRAGVQEGYEIALVAYRMDEEAKRQVLSGARNVIINLNDF